MMVVQALDGDLAAQSRMVTPLAFGVGFAVLGAWLSRRPKVLSALIAAGSVGLAGVLLFAHALRAWERGHFDVRTLAAGVALMSSAVLALGFARRLRGEGFHTRSDGN